MSTGCTDQYLGSLVQFTLNTTRSSSYDRGLPTLMLLRSFLSKSRLLPCEAVPHGRLYVRV